MLEMSHAVSAPADRYLVQGLVPALGALLHLTYTFCVPT